MKKSTAISIVAFWVLIVTVKMAAITLVQTFFERIKCLPGSFVSTQKLKNLSTEVKNVFGNARRSVNVSVSRKNYLVSLDVWPGFFWRDTKSNQWRCQRCLLFWACIKRFLCLSTENFIDVGNERCRVKCAIFLSKSKLVRLMCDQGSLPFFEQTQESISDVNGVRGRCRFCSHKTATEKNTSFLTVKKLIRHQSIVLENVMPFTTYLLRHRIR